MFTFSWVIIPPQYESHIGLILQNELFALYLGLRRAVLDVWIMVNMSLSMMRMQPNPNAHQHKPVSEG